MGKQRPHALRRTYMTVHCVLKLACCARQSSSVDEIMGVKALPNRPDVLLCT